MNHKSEIQVGIAESHFVWKGRFIPLPKNAHNKLVEAMMEQQKHKINLLLHGRTYAIDPMRY